MGSVKRGDIVWARISPEKWWPGLVLRIDTPLGVLVSFFNLQKPRYFDELEIRGSFIEKFKSLFWYVGCSSNGSMLLDHALILLAQRTAFSLMCPCFHKKQQRNHMMLMMMDVGWDWDCMEEQVVEVRNSFQPVEVLGFVVSKAICPWLQDVDIVNALTGTAQIMSFRRYVSIHQSFAYRRAKPHDDAPKAVITSIYSKLHPYSYFGKEIQPVTQESDILVVEDQCDVFSDLVQKNLNVSVKNIKNSRSIVSDETFEYPQEAQHDIVTELNAPMEENLKSVEGQQVVLISKIEKQDGADVARREHKMDYSLVNLNFLYSEKLIFRTLSYNNITDLPLGKSSPCIAIVAQFSHSGYDYSIKTQLSDKVDGKSGGGETFGSLIPYMQSPVNHLKRRLDQPAVSDRLKLGKTTPFFSISGCYLQRNRTMYNQDLSDAFFSGSLAKLKILNLPSTGSQKLTCLDVVQNNVCPVKDTSHCCEIVDIGRVQEPEENTSILNNSRTCISYNYDANNKIIDRVPTEDVHVKIACEDSVKDNRVFHQPVSCELSVKLESKTESSFHIIPTSLHMKFPKDFDLPSKHELVKKFTQYGSVDSFKSKIFFHSGYAQVVFLHRLDAVAAYHYGKRKKALFGQANVRFWLDSFERKRKGISLTKPPECYLKSSLKKSMPLGKEDRKKSQRVRFCLRSP